MIKLLLVLLNLPRPVLGAVLVGSFVLLLVILVLVTCVPSASARILRFLALLEELLYSGAVTKPSRPNGRLFQRDSDRKGGNADDRE